MIRSFCMHPDGDCRTFLLHTDVNTVEIRTTGEDSRICWDTEIEEFAPYEDETLWRIEVDPPFEEEVNGTALRILHIVIVTNLGTWPPLAACQASGVTITYR